MAIQITKVSAYQTSDGAIHHNVEDATFHEMSYQAHMLMAECPIIDEEGEEIKIQPLELALWLEANKERIYKHLQDYHDCSELNS